MITSKNFESMVLSLPGTEPKQHFDRIGFKVTGRRMFASYLEENNTANIFLSPAEQALFCDMDSTNIFPVPNKWGLKGITTFNLNQVSKELVMEALISAYDAVIKSKKKK